MTVQVRDAVFYRNQEWTLLGKNGPSLFDPAEHGLEPVSNSSANWRGFTCQYAIREGCLFLDQLHARIYDPDGTAERAPLVFGKEPEVMRASDRLKAVILHLEAAGLQPFPVSHHDDFVFHLGYTDMAAPIGYTGGLLLGSAFIEDEENTRVRDAHRAWYYAVVSELLLADGRVTQENDRSSPIAALRRDRPALSRAETWEQVKGCLTLDFDLRT